MVFILDPELPTAVAARQNDTHRPAAWRTNSALWLAAEATGRGVLRAPRYSGPDVRVLWGPAAVTSSRVRGEGGQGAPRGTPAKSAIKRPSQPLALLGLQHRPHC